MDDSLFAREVSTLMHLKSLVQERAVRETEIAQTYQTAADALEREWNKLRRAFTTARQKELSQIDDAYQQQVADIAAKYSGLLNACARHRAEAIRKAEDDFAVNLEQTNTEYQDRLWTLDSLLEAGEKEAKDERVKLHRMAESARKTAEATWQRIEPTLLRVGLEREDVIFPERNLPRPIQTDPEGKLERCLEDVEETARRVDASFLPRLLGIPGIAGLTLVAGAIGFGAGFAMGERIFAVLGAIGGAFVGGALLWLLVKVLARRQVRNRASAHGVFQAELARAATRLELHADETYKQQKAGLKQRHTNDQNRTHEHYRPLMARMQRTHEHEVQQVEVECADRTGQLENERAIEQRAAEADYTTKVDAVNSRHDAEVHAAEQEHQEKFATIKDQHDRDWQILASNWLDGMAEVRQTLQDLIEAGEDTFPDWAPLAAGTHALPATVPTGVRYGELHVDSAALPSGEPADSRLSLPEPLALTVPAYLPFPERCGILLKARDEGRTVAVQALQAMMLRFLTGLPPGKVRFTIIDPVGLGENFAAFMHLADHDEQLVGARIWTEARQIEQRLADLTEHMENVIQKYLRNQYKSIEEYNQAAGEVAEPYRVLVIANFPTNFTPEAARRLISIVSSGPACGVCTLISVDTRASFPREFRLADLEQVAFGLHWKDDHFELADSRFADFPLTLDQPPDATGVAAIVRRVGEAGKVAARVEVPFDFIMPSTDQIWAGSSARGFEVPIGRAGATKRQLLALGRGTAQHALVAGKTGSGKSTLLHALITNLALIYGPDEAELYLIDFKKGVEFKAYAEHQLPQARVIAIESEREFGLSVLQRLDAELRDRGDRFRNVGANDLAGYREATGQKLPRILLIVDEFQEFFVEDDKLAQEAALLLDRLVRQGRAFGLHILLGSQTLGGAYSLARSTIDQMAVRIALQCSDTDAQLILSKENSAARLLSRPGEAIYNDANGLVEGNDPFQVVWLEESQREDLLKQLSSRSNGHVQPPLVFEGNIPADLAENAVLREWAEQPRGEVSPVTAFLGDPIAIKEPTAAIFRPQSGANVLMIGQQEEAALALMASSLVSLALQCPGELPDGARRFTILDGTPDEAEQSDYLRQASQTLGFGNAVVERYELATALEGLHAELQRRQQGDRSDRLPRFLFIHGLQRFRELRKAEDDFGFGRKDDKPASPAELFSTVLREGPPLGIHTIIWCDTLTNLNRGLDRQAVREFTQRVLFQMSATDSSHLIDSPLASKLGRTRALLVQEELERPEKFRPYRLPELAFLRSLGEKRTEPAAS